jgi:hypothetical protein
VPSLKRWETYRLEQAVAVFPAKSYATH